MTGRRLYDKYVDSMLAVQEKHWRVPPDPLPVAWPYLTLYQRRRWNELARRITPRKRKP